LLSGSGIFICFRFKKKNKHTKKFLAIVSELLQELNVSNLSRKYSAAAEQMSNSYKSDIYSSWGVFAAKVKNFKGRSSNS